MEFELVIKNGTIVTMNPEQPLVKKGMVGITGDKIITVITDPTSSITAHKTIDAKNAVVTPGLIDCHTHVVYGGSRAFEFEKRLQGISYEEIAKSGGGILSTVQETRSASVERLRNTAIERIRSMIQKGATTVEIKSGYGLDLDSEIKMLEVARSLEKSLPITIVTTFLGAHAVAPEFNGDSEAFTQFIIEKMLPEISRRKLADMIDAFCETIAFSTQQVKQLFEIANSHNIPFKLHAEQLGYSGSAVMAAKLGAKSVDHLEYLKPEECETLATNNTAAVLLPGAFYFLKEKQKPPIQAMRKHGVKMAIATDCNPGSSPFVSLPLMMNMACVMFGLTIEEALKAVTINAAWALGIQKQVGSIETGKKADLAIWNTDSVNNIVYQPDFCYAERIIKNGRTIIPGQI